MERKSRGDQNSWKFAAHHSQVIDKEFQPFLSNVSSSPSPLPAKKKFMRQSRGEGGGQILWSMLWIFTGWRTLLINLNKVRLTVREQWAGPQKRSFATRFPLSSIARWLGAENSTLRSSNCVALLHCKLSKRRFLRRLEWEDLKSYGTRASNTISVTRYLLTKISCSSLLSTPNFTVDCSVVGKLTICITAHFVLGLTLFLSMNFLLFWKSIDYSRVHKWEWASFTKKISKPLENSRFQKSDNKQVP